MGRIRFRGRNRVKTKFSDRNVVPGSIKYVDPGTCLTWKNHGDLTWPSWNMAMIHLNTWLFKK